MSKMNVWIGLALLGLLASACSALPVQAEAAGPALPSQSEPWTDPQAVIAELENLSAAGQETYAGGGWWYQRVETTAQSGDLHAGFTEKWSRPAPAGGVCFESLTVQRESPGGAVIRQSIQLADGTLADVTPGDSQSILLAGGEHPSHCSAGLENAVLDSLLLFLRGENVGTTKDGRTLSDVKAWYEGAAQAETFVVEANWDLPFSRLNRQEERYVFDAATGLLQQQDMAMLWSDGSPMGSLQQVYAYTQIAELPAGVADLFQESVRQVEALAR
ncbi:MAG: hypothetical protein GYA17_03280 [Chloroflexi bacterium]|nr:hypothetical protein [Chloroflexota bacterium]